MRPLVLLSILSTLATPAEAQSIALRELGEHRTEAVVELDAPPGRVYDLLSDYQAWRTIFRDIVALDVLSGGRDDAKVRMKSRVLGQTVTVQFRNTPGVVTRFVLVDGPPGARGNGTIELTPLAGGSRTRVRAVLFMDAVGFPGLFMTEGRLRKMRQAKLRGDLEDLARVVRPSA